MDQIELCFGVCVLMPKGKTSVTVNCVMLLYTNAQGQDKAYLMARHFIVMPYCHSVHRRVRVQLDDIIE